MKNECFLKICAKIACVFSEWFSCVKPFFSQVNRIKWNRIDFSPLTHVINKEKSRVFKVAQSPLSLHGHWSDQITLHQGQNA
jgi:hypothetical protein